MLTQKALYRIRVAQNATELGRFDIEYIDRVSNSEEHPRHRTSDNGA